jgi:arylsulfatase A-like enzyme
VEGKSLVPIFKGKQRRGHTALFWELNDHRAVRSGKWKLVGKKKQAWELYNLQIDRGETNNLADRRPIIVNKLGAMYREWSQRCNEGN